MDSSARSCTWRGLLAELQQEELYVPGEETLHHKEMYLEKRLGRFLYEGLYPEKW